MKLPNTTPRGKIHRGVANDRSAPGVFPDAKIKAAGTAEREMDAILRFALCKGSGAQSKLDMMLRRFGIARCQENFKQIGDSLGLTGERIRQIEMRMFEQLLPVQRSIKLPAVDAVVKHVHDRAGAPWPTVESELKPLLGSVPLREALRFGLRIRGKKSDLSFEHGRIFRQDYLQIIAAKPDQAKLATQVSVAARKFVSFAAAAMVQDVRTYVEHQRKEDVPSQRILDVLTSLPGLIWLDESHRWFTFGEPKQLNRTLKRAAIIVTLAGVPVDIDTIYLGLARESKRSKSGKSVGFIDPLPPVQILAKLLEVHPAFHRNSASSFSMREPFDTAVHLEGFHRAMIKSIEAAHGGVATIHELRQVKRGDGVRIKEDYLGLTLYVSCFLSRPAPSLYAIRGRPVSESALAAARERLQRQ